MRPAPRAASSSPPPDGEREVWRERPFAVRVEDGEGRPALVTGAFDRVVLTRAGDELVAAEVVDFKTDQVDGQVPHELVERYQPQMDEYRRVLATLTGLPADLVGARLVFLAADAVVDVGA